MSTKNGEREDDGKSQQQILPGDLLVNGSDLGHALRISTQTVSALTAAGIFRRLGGEQIKGKVGRYHLADSIAAWVKYKCRSKGEDETSKSYAIARQERMQEAAKLARLQRLEKEAELIDLDLVVTFLEDLVIRCRNGIMAVPARVARKIAHKDPTSIMAIFKTELARALSELSQTKITDIEVFRKADQEPKEQEVDAMERSERAKSG
jgi:phage terminase Nu1 subunit (DNA packaging protein)